MESVILLRLGKLIVNVLQVVKWTNTPQNINMKLLGKKHCGESRFESSWGVVQQGTEDYGSR